MSRRVWLCAIICACWALITPAALRAQAPAREPAFVYAANAYTPKGYVPSIYLPRHDTLYLLADQPSALAPRRTLVYWWPLSNEYRADWTERNELITSTLEVVRAGQVVQTYRLSDYVVQYDAQNAYDTLQLFSGAEASARYDAFVQARTAYWEQVRAYQDQFMEYTLKLNEAAQQSDGGTKPQAVPERPQPPADFTLYSSVPVQAFSVKLPAGEYRIRLRRPDGSLLPEGERSLIVFQARRQAISYTIVPQNKWTVPEQSDDPSHVIYTQGRSTLYFQPFFAEEYNELYYTRLNNPQSREGRADRWEWVNLKPFAAASLAVTPEGGAARPIAFRPYRVNQLPGTALGYEVVDYDPKTMRGSPSFEGFKLDVDASVPALSIVLTGRDGQPVPGSQRQVRLLQTPNPIIFYALPFVAFLIGGAMIAWRRSQLMKLPREVVM